jgi:putative DNA primase/helicase
MRDAIEQFRDAIRAAGLCPPDIIEPDGRLHRFPSNGKRRDDSGFYALHLDGIPAGYFGCWRTGLTEKWRANMGRKLTTEEREVNRKRMAELKSQREAEEAKRRAAAARKAGEVWKAGTPAGEDHPYLVRKAVSPVETLREIAADELVHVIGYPPQASGERLAGRVLLAPVKIGDKLSSVEMIDEAGRKSALAGGAKAGGYWAVQPLPEGDGAGHCIMIAEGVATALSAREANGHAAIAALSAGQLEAAAKTIRKRYPTAAIVILADLLKDTAESDPRALQAARAVGGAVAVPDFGGSREAGDTDFNDLAQRCGKDAVQRDIAAVLASLMGDTETRADDDPATLGEPLSVAHDSDVTAVTDVQASNDVASGVTPADSACVTGVTPSPIPKLGEKRFVALDDWREGNGRKYRPGVWWFSFRENKDSMTPIEEWICSPLHLEAVTHDDQQHHFGRLLRFKNTLGRWREWAMPMELLKGSGDELRGELLAMGVQIDPNGHRLLGRYLQALTPERRVHCALSVGWCGNSYVLPDVVIGPNAAGVIFQSGERGHDEHSRAGTLSGWREGIAAQAVGNPLLALALSASFAGPLLARCNAESGGIHFIGDSSTGKTTAIEAACATWGGPGFRRSWRATANGMEGAATMFNDCLLALDEISECDPREVGAIVYALGNGRGKQRASRSGAARAVTRWRCAVLSSGERTIGTTIAEGGKQAKAGQSVRLLDVPAARRYGAWDTLHGFPNGPALSDAIKRTAATHYGHAGRAYLERLTRDPRDFAEMLERIKSLPAFAADGGEGQDKRAAARFAMLALAGELATEYGITGWPEGEAINAAAEAFKAWRGLRGTGNDEHRQIVERVADFLERHGDSRFSDVNLREGDSMRINRAGWWRDEAGGRKYLFTSAGLNEALSGFDFKRALVTLQRAGVLPPSSGERSKPERIGGRTVRIYTIHADQLRGSDGA